LGVGINFEEVFAREDLAASVENPEAAHLDQLVEHAEVLFLGHLAVLAVEIAHGQVVIAVQALERTTPRHFDGNLQGHTFARLAFMQSCAELAVTYLLHACSLGCGRTPLPAHRSEISRPPSPSTGRLRPNPPT